jgi:tetratricopeptide (TPR) repeat protein
LYRFWPERDRLPFLDIHQFGTPEDRYLHTRAQSDPHAWETLDRKYHFDYVVLAPYSSGMLTLPAFVKSDSAWAMVYDDDAGSLYVRRSSFPTVARDYQYDLLSASDFALIRILAACGTDTLLRQRLRHDALRQLGSAPHSARARMLLGVLDAMDADFVAATRYFREALAIDPFAPRLREKLGLLALAQGHFSDARRYFRDENRIVGWPDGYDFRMGQVSAAEGDINAARRAYLRELSKHPANTEARDSLAALGRRTLSQ